MKYVGLQTQKSQNNLKSVFLLFLFPCLVLFLTYLFCALLTTFALDNTEEAFNMFLSLAPYVIIIVGIWFLIAYYSNTAIIKSATGARTLERKENMRVYNLVENLCMSKGMEMPIVNVIENNALNAYAAGINKKTYTVSLTRGIINNLDDDELEGVIAHELAHIRNHDVRLLIVSIVFVGIFAMITQIAFRTLLRTPTGSRNNKDGKGAFFIVLIALVIAAIGYFCTTMMRFAISRKREYLADAAAAEMTQQPLALASALRKISRNPNIEAIKRDDVAQLFIEHPIQKKSLSAGIASLFATHPPIEKRIAILEQF